MHRKDRGRGLRLAALLLAACLLAGCGGGKENRVVFTGGLSGEELLKVNEKALTVPEAKILLMTEFARYRNLYGDGMLEREFGGQTLKSAVREQTLALLGKVMVIDEMADKYQIFLDEEETDRTEQAAADYFGRLTQEERSYTGAVEEDVQRLFARIALADKVFYELTEGEDVEISDDEARVVTFRHIMKRTADVGEDGLLKPYGDMKKQEAYTEILAVFDRLLQGEDFDALAESESEDAQTEYTVGRGELDEALEEKIFSMESGEMSNVVESAEGYHIVLCVENFDREATEQNKKQLTADRRWEIFEETYNAFAAEQVCEFKEKRWEELPFPEGENFGTEFYDVYRTWFSTEQVSQEEAE